MKGLERSVLHFAGIHPVRQSLFGMVGTLNPNRAERWLARMRALGERAA